MISPSEFSELQKLCRRSFPDRLDQHISRVEPLAEGRSRARALTLSWGNVRRPEVERLVFRRFADSWTWWRLDDRGKALREWAVMRWLYGEGLPVPRVYASGSERDDAFVLAAHTAGRRWLPGQEGSQAPAEPCVTELARLLARLHRSAPPDGVRQVLPDVTLAEELGRLRDVANQCAEVELSEVLDELLSREVEVRPSCVLHGDPSMANVLCDARGITALLNWENSALGDARWDVARAANWLHTQQAEEWVEAFCTAYEEESRQSLSNMDFWQALVATQSWALAVWVRAQSDPQQGSQAAVDAVLGQMDGWREHAWRALTRLRYTNESALAKGDSDV